MNRSKIVLFVSILAVLAGVSVWAQSIQSTVVPISGEYWDNAAEGLLVYSGTIVLNWVAAPGSDQTSPVTGSLVATAWAKNTGASYTFYGYYADVFAGATDSTSELARKVLAIGYNSKPEFETTLNVKLAQFPQEVQHLAFAGR
jgi:hypothetical protein